MIGLKRSSAIAACWWKRSEEHTSELQSQSNLVCRLLLEKKKKLIRSDRKNTRLNSSHSQLSDAVFCFKTHKPIHIRCLQDTVLSQIPTQDQDASLHIHST